MVDVTVHLHTLGTDGHRTQAPFELPDDIVREEERVCINCELCIVNYELIIGVQFYRTLILQTRVADIVVLIERVVQIVAVGLRYRRRTTAPTHSN